MSYGTTRCEHHDLAGNYCPRAAAWIVGMPHDDRPEFACTAHLGTIIRLAHARYAATTTDPSFRVRAL